MSVKMFDNLRIHGGIYTFLNNDLAKLVVMQNALKQANGWSDAALAAGMAEYAFAETWVKSGEIVYNLSHSLAAMFSLTSSPEVDWDHLPHAAFIIQVPRAFLPLSGTIEPESSYLYVHKPSTKVGSALVVADYDSVAVAELRCNIGRAGVSGFIEGLTPQKAVKSIQAAYIDREAIGALIRERLKNDRTFGSLSAEAIDQAIDAAGARAQRMLDENKARASELYDTTAVGLNVLAMRFLANTLAYIAEAQPGSINPASSIAQRRPQILNVLPPRELVVTRAFRDAAKDAIAATMAGSIIGIRRSLKHHVRGHWRNQAVGPGHSRRRRTWVHPHERGSEDFGSVVRKIETISIPPGSTN